MLYKTSSRGWEQWTVAKVALSVDVMRVVMTTSGKKLGDVYLLAFTNARTQQQTASLPEAFSQLSI